MRSGKFLGNAAAFVAVGIASSILLRAEPFRSNFLLAILGGCAVGLIIAVVELGARKAAGAAHSKRAPHKPQDLPDSRS
jgi:hypothetical protein